MSLLRIAAVKSFLTDLLCFIRIPVPYGRTDILQSRKRQRIVPLAPVTGPQRVLVQCKTFMLRVPEHHGTKTSVSQRKRIMPLFRRPFIG